jgi:hypothetical protein
MRPRHLLACLFLGTAAAGPVGAAAPVPADHPILGTWTLTPAEQTCTETYFFRRDGTALITSAEEVAESDYEISGEPDAGGFYRYTDRIVKDNGKKDCAGNVTLPGQGSTNYIAFHRSGEMFVMCQTASLERCLGPFRRAHGEGS